MHGTTGRGPSFRAKARCMDLVFASHYSITTSSGPSFSWLQVGGSWVALNASEVEASSSKVAEVDGVRQVDQADEDEADGAEVEEADDGDREVSLDATGRARDEDESEDVYLDDGAEDADSEESQAIKDHFVRKPSCFRLEIVIRCAWRLAFLQIRMTLDITQSISTCFHVGISLLPPLPTLSNDRYSTYNMQHARKKPDIEISTVVLWGWNQPNNWKHMKSSWRKINASAGSAAESFAPCYYYCNFLLLLCCDPLDRAEHGAYIVRLVYVYVALLKRDKTCTCTLLNWSFSAPYTKFIPTLSCTTAKDEDDDGLSDLGDEESGEDGESQKNLPNYNMANVSLVEEGRSLRQMLTQVVLQCTC